MRWSRRADRPGARRGSTELVVRELGTRADEAVECLRLRARSLDLEVTRIDPRVVLVLDAQRRPEPALQEVVAIQLDACDPAWRDFASFAKGRGLGQHITGSER
jgi:hypothetical protein